MYPHLGVGPLLYPHLGVGTLTWARVLTCTLPWAWVSSPVPSPGRGSLPVPSPERGSSPVPSPVPALTCAVSALLCRGASSIRWLDSVVGGMPYRSGWPLISVAIIFYYYLTYIILGVTHVGPGT